MFMERASTHILAAALILVAIGPFVEATVDCPDCPNVQGESAYVPEEIIVKFRQGVADALERQLTTGTNVQDLELSDSLDFLTRRYQPTGIVPVVPDFKANRQRIEALLGRDDAGLTYSERRMVRRLKRAPEGADSPGFGQDLQD